MKRLILKKHRQIFLMIGALVAIIIDSQAGLHGYKTNLTLLIIYYLACFVSPLNALLTAGLIGLIIDSISLRFIGPNILSYGIIVMIMVFAKVKIINWTQIFNFILGFSITIISGFTSYFCLAIFDTMPVELNEAFYLLLFQGVVNGVVTYLFSIRDE
jgi:cell shape-determining protein MreD